MKRCLDTTFLADLLRGDADLAALLRKWGAAGDEAVTTEVNFYEAALGVELTQVPALRDRYGRAWQGILQTMEVLPLTRRATLEAVRRQAALYAHGTPAPVPDLLVAAIAKVGGCGEIVTENTRDFVRIGLVPVAGH